MERLPEGGAVRSPAIHFETDPSGRNVATVIGELDATTADTLRRALADSPTAPDVVDLRFVDLLSAAAVNVLLEAFERHPFRLIGSTIVERVLRILDLDERFGVHRAARQPALVTAPFGVSVHDTDAEFRYVYVNETLADINGLAASSHLQRRLDELFEVEHDDITPIMRSVSANHRPRTIEVSGATPAVDDGSWTCTFSASRYVDEAQLRDVVVATVTADDPSQDASTHLSFRRRGE